VKIVGDVLTRPVVLKSRQILLCWLPGRRPDVGTAAKHGTGQRKGQPCAVMPIMGAKGASGFPIGANQPTTDKALRPTDKKTQLLLLLPESWLPTPAAGHWQAWRKGDTGAGRGGGAYLEAIWSPAGGRIPKTPKIDQKAWCGRESQTKTRFFVVALWHRKPRPAVPHLVMSVDLQASSRSRKCETWPLRLVWSSGLRACFHQVEPPIFLVQGTCLCRRPTTNNHAQRQRHGPHSAERSSAALPQPPKNAPPFEFKGGPGQEKGNRKPGAKKTPGARRATTGGPALRGRVFQDSPRPHSGGAEPRGQRPNPRHRHPGTSKGGGGAQATAGHVRCEFGAAVRVLFSGLYTYDRLYRASSQQVPSAVRRATRSPAAQAV
jgi:hypothetical protein